MELSKQGQPTTSTSMGSQSVPSPNIQSSQVEYPPMFYAPLPVNWASQPLLSAGASIPISSYYIVPMNERSVQAETSRVEAPHLVGVQPLSSISRVSLRPPQQVLSIQTSMPTIIGSQPSPATIAKKLTPTGASPKVQMLKSGSPQSSNKRPAQKEPPQKVQSQLFESVRSKLRESLAAALSADSDQQNKQQSEEKIPLVESGSEQRQLEGMPLPDTSLSASANASTASFEAHSTVDAERGEEGGKIDSSSELEEKSNSNNDLQEQSKLVSSEGEVHSDCMVVADELLQGHGLCWASDFDAGVSESVTEPDSKRVKIASDIDAGATESVAEPDLKSIKAAHETLEDTRGKIRKAENLAFRIEAELFKLFGGVNKKYKEKGRSLLFNLKDKSNPELRERVLSGDIAPERLCSMTAEELASKELSQWRLAKAEELAQMVVLPDTEVDVRRLVKKTHKGEFQVEVEQSDGISVEVELGAGLISQVPSKANGVQTKPNDKTSPSVSTQGEAKASEGTEQDGSDNLEVLLNEKTDLMQELMVDDLKDAENLPPIVSLDEFMEALDTEPPFENLSVDTLQADPSSSEKAVTILESEGVSEPEEGKVPASEDGSGSDPHSSQDNCQSKLESSQDGLDSNLDNTVQSDRDPLIKSSPDKEDDKKADVDDALKSDSVDVQSKTSLPDVTLRESMWEGVIQLTLSSLANIVATFKSGEKPSIKDWPNFIEIKGRVRLDAFEKFLQELPLSRSRAIMITELAWKEGSVASGRQHLSQTIDSYIADERLGFAEPAPGVELYLCPPRGKTVEMLARLLPKEHSQSLTVTGMAVIGVVVWRRPHVTSRIPSHHRHSGSKKQSSSRKQQVTGSNSVPRSSMPLNSFGTPPGFPNLRHHEDDVTDDVPPGFGPGVVGRDDDDLPEFDFVNTSNGAARVTAQAYKGRPDVFTSARPVEQMRELVHKYGKRSTIEVQPWNDDDDDDDDDDDIPEWNPNQNIRPKIQQPPLQKPPPPQPRPQQQQPISQMHSYQQPQQQEQYHAVQPLQMNHQFSPMANNQLLSQARLPSQQHLQPAPPPPLLPMQHQQPFQPVPNMQPGWRSSHSNVWWPQAGTPAPGMIQPSQFGVLPNKNGQAYGMGNYGGMGWRPDNRGV